MKFLIFGNAPNAPTGYGVQIGHLSRLLVREGHDVAVACSWGHQIGVRDLAIAGGTVRLYPMSPSDPNSVDSLLAHAVHFFDGDPQGGWIITCTDVWSLNKVAPAMREFRVAAWVPVDHFPVPQGVLDFFQRSNAKPIAMSRFGERMLIEAGLDPWYVPLSVDTSAYKPTALVDVGGQEVTPRHLFGIEEDAFVVLMVAMSKDPIDRKGFNEAFRGFGQFHRTHRDAVLWVHSEPTGAYGSGLDMRELAKHSAIPEHAVRFTDRYAYQNGLPPEMMAALYSIADVLLAPSHGEGFCVPMIEAQACGVPVVASDFTAQSELIGAGWPVHGQLWFDHFQNASYLMPFIDDVAGKLTAAFDADREVLSVRAQAFAAGYDTEVVFEQWWRPVLERMCPPVPKADKPKMESVDVIVPIIRDGNRTRLFNSLTETSAWRDTGPHTESCATHPEFCDHYPVHSWDVYEGDEGRTFAENVNACLAKSTADWVLIVGDDVEFTPGWFEAAQALSDRYDVIGTNDSEPGRTRNPRVAAGEHADHFFVRRSYIDELGACLDGPGVLASESYGHWFTDVEIIELAKARGVYGHAHDCRIIHHHPGYDGDEAARAADPVYSKATETAQADERNWLERKPIIDSLRAVA